jgi:hypothetical protein
MGRASWIVSVRMFAMIATCAMLTMLMMDRWYALVHPNAATSVNVMDDDDHSARSEPLLSSGEIARRVGVAPATISAWVRQGRLVPTVTTMGGRYRWHWSDVQRQMRAQRESNGP